MTIKRSVTKEGIKVIPKHVCNHCKEVIEDQKYIQFYNGKREALFIHISCNERLINE